MSGPPLIRVSLATLRSRVAAAAPRSNKDLLKLLEADPRQGAKALALRLRRMLESERREKARLGRLLAMERRLQREGFSHVAGVDEAGVGPMAGPVVAAAVMLPVGVTIDGVDDSKRLKAATRTALEPIIRSRSLAVGVGLAEPEEIDRLNVYHAGLLAMRRAVVALSPAPDHLLVDARRIPELPMPQSPVVGGDRKCHAIACASVIAKVHRDRIMDQLAAHYPGYGFERHKGYGTREHMQALQRLGPSPVHRRSYTALAEQTGGLSKGYYALREAIEGASDGEALEQIRSELRGAGLSEGERRRLVGLVGRRRKRVEGRG